MNAPPALLDTWLPDEQAVRQPMAHGPRTGLAKALTPPLRPAA